MCGKGGTYLYLLESFYTHLHWHLGDGWVDEIMILGKTGKGTIDRGVDGIAVVFINM
jgi:hypothetical protein